MESLVLDKGYHTVHKKSYTHRSLRPNMKANYIFYVKYVRVYIVTYFYCVAITIMFDQKTYSVDENARLVQPRLVLTNPSSTDISVEISVSSSDGSATGKYCKQWSNHIINMLQEVLIILLDHTLSHFLLE